LVLLTTWLKKKVGYQGCRGPGDTEKKRRIFEREKSRRGTAGKRPGGSPQGKGRETRKRRKKVFVLDTGKRRVLIGTPISRTKKGNERKGGEKKRGKN